MEYVTSLKQKFGEGWGWVGMFEVGVGAVIVKQFENVLGR